MRKSTVAALRDNRPPSDAQHSESSKKADQKKIDEAIKFLQRQGGEVFRRSKKFQMPLNPGLGSWAAADCLVRYGKFKRKFGEDEFRRLTDIRSGWNVADIR